MKYFHPMPKPVAQKKQLKQPVKKTRAVMTNFDKAAFVRSRGPLCECGCGERGEDAHHALFNRSIKFPELDVPENLVLVNHFEHVSLRKFNTLEWRKFFWVLLCQKHGATHMREWLNSLPQKLQARIDFI